MPAGIQPSPVRRKAAIKAIEETEGLSDEDMIDVADMIENDTKIADMYLAFGKKSTRTAYLARRLACFKA